MIRRELHKQLLSAARPIYGDGEARQITRMIEEELWGITRTQMIADPDAQVEVDNLEQVLTDIRSSRPVQYIIGEADFCDFRLGVREGVLIPRPESEELIRWVVSESCCSQRIVDVGTGSGALAIALSRAIRCSQVWAVDVSPEALEIAGENIARLAPDVELVAGDALQGIENITETEGAEILNRGEVDIIISNPPYIPRREMAQMRDNVVQHEPHLALFVDDCDPLIFYRAIARSGLQLLRRGGRIYFEIHENYARECQEMLAQMGYGDVRLRRDINDKARMICAQRE